jgi:SAM-dependent methyltransferase
MDPYYPKRYRQYGFAPATLLNRLYEMRVTRWSQLRRKPGSVLEVGCGSGVMLAAFRRRGWDVLGIERNDEAAAAGRREQGVEILTGGVAGLPADARFDLIVLFQVLEHLADPVAVLSECARRLAPGGKVVVNVPNFSSWQSRFAGPLWLHLDVPRHLVHYTPETLANTLGRAGLRVSGLRFSSLEHDPYGWVESTISRVTRRHNTLTRCLMRLDPLDARAAVAVLLGAALLAPAVLLAAVSWWAKRGALMEAIATAGDDLSSSLGAGSR